MMPGEGGGGIYHGGDAPAGDVVDIGATHSSGTVELTHADGSVTEVSMDEVDNELVKSDALHFVRKLENVGEMLVRFIVGPLYNVCDKLFTALQMSMVAWLIVGWPLLVSSSYGLDKSSEHVREVYDTSVKPVIALPTAWFSIFMFVTDLILGYQAYKILKNLAPDEPMHAGAHRLGVEMLALFFLLPLFGGVWITAFSTNHFYVAFAYSLLMTGAIMYLHRGFQRLDKSTDMPMKLVFYWNVYLTLLGLIIAIQNDQLST